MSQNSSGSNSKCKYAVKGLRKDTTCTSLQRKEVFVKEKDCSREKCMHFTRTRKRFIYSRDS